MGNVGICTPFPLPPVLEQKHQARMQLQEGEQWLNIKWIIAAIAVPKPSVNRPKSTSFSEDSTSADETETSRLLLPKDIDGAKDAYGTFNLNTSLHAEEESEAVVVPLRPTTLLASAALTPIYLILMLLPMLPFWTFTSFLVYVAATTPLSQIRITLVALAFLLPFNIIGTAAIIRFALGERERVLQAGIETDEEVGAPSSPVSVQSGASSGSENKRHWRPSMQFVLHGARREGRRM